MIGEREMICGAIEVWIAVEMISLDEAGRLSQG
jgi:hypothetical protein